MMRRAAIIQSAYIPWKGFFDLIGRCDIYVIYDSAAFSKGHWHNRNRIKRANGSPWLTIPVKTAGKLGQPLDEVAISGAWADRHWTVVEKAYQETPFFIEESAAVRALYEHVAAERSLSKVNETFLRWVTERLGLKTEILRDRRLPFGGERNQRLVDICHAVSATHYLSGPSAADYLDVGHLKRSGVTVEWMRYGPYLEYRQPHGSFEHAVSILDTLFCCGADASTFIRSES